MTVAQLGFAIDSSDAAGAAADLDKLTSSAAKAEQAAGKTGAAGTRMSRAFADVSPSLDKIVASLGRLETTTLSIDKRLEAMSRSAGKATAANKNLDASVVETSAAYKQLEASLSAVQAAQRKGDISLQQSVAMIDKQRQAIAKLNAELKLLHNNPGNNPGNTPGGGNRPPGQRPPPANNNDGGRRQNLGYQAFDIGQGLTSGMPLGMIAAQQLPQVAQLYAGQGGVKSFLGDVASLATGAVSAVGALPLAIGAVGAAALIYDKTVASSAVKAEKALKRHEESLERIKGLFDGAATASEQYGRRVQGSIDFSARSDQRGLEEALAAQTVSAGKQLQNAAPRSSGAALTNLYGPYLDTVQHFIAQAQEGKGDVKAFNDEVLRIANENPADVKLQKIAQKLVDTTKAALDTAQAIKDLNDEVARTTMLTARTDAASAAAKYQAGNVESLFYMRKQQGAALSGIGARSPAHIAAAARARAEAEPVNGNESPEVRQYRIEATAALALAEAEQQVSDAKRDRAMNLEKTVKDQQIEIDLIGKTGGAAVALRKEYELTSQLRLDAARQGLEVDQKELDLIRQRSEELGKLTDQYNQSRFNFDINQQNRDFNFTSDDREVAGKLRSYGLPEDMKGANAGMLRDQIEREKNRAMIGGFFTDFRDSLVENGGDMGKALGDAIKNALLNAMTRATDQIIEKLATSLTNALFGGGPATQSAAATGGGFLGSAFGAANDNKGFAAPVGAVTRMALPPVGATKTGIPLSQITAAGGLTAKVSADYAPRFQGLLNDLEKAGYPVKSLGEGGYSYRKVAGSNNLSKHSFGEALDINPRQNPWSNNFQTDMPANVNDLAKKNGLTWGGTWNKPDTMHFQVDKTANMASEALDKLAGNAGAATEGLGQLGGGLSKIGESLSTSFFPAAPAAGGGGGGIGSWFSSLFGGGGLSAATIAKYTPLTGLFANGTDYAPGGMAMVGERGPELVNLPQGSGVMSNHKLMSALAANNNGGQGGGVQGIRVFFDNNGNLDAKLESVSRKNARQASGQAIGQYSKQQTRGGFGDTQSVYASDKG
ncbi:M15 family metallopeptidase [Pararhizobium sp. DWP1-1-3]|uniref:M15 family metallopeptidase n=1 Tax=Pararhizobium sp. DWP1-1-3 TaxID=2804652 RepID=UPI003CF257D8